MARKLTRRLDESIACMLKRSTVTLALDVRASIETPRHNR